MLNLNILERLRTKEELVNYFEEKGQNITEEEVESLRQSYEQVQENSNTLTMQQLDDVAGGWGIARYYNERTQKRCAKTAVRMFNAIMENKDVKAELFRNKDGLFQCRIETGKTTSIDLDTPIPEVEALNDQIDQINQDYMNNKISATCIDVITGIGLVCGLASSAIMIYLAAINNGNGK